MTTTNTYNISPMIEELAVFPVDTRNLITVFLKALQAVKNITGVSYREMMASKGGKNYRRVSDAKHYAMYLTFTETYDTKLSERSIANVFGLSSNSSVRRSKVKMQTDFMFRKVYKEVKKEYDNIVLVEYDQAIPF